MRNDLKEDVMFRVKTVSIFNKILDPHLVKSFLLIVSFFAIGYTISLKDVFTNMFSSIGPEQYLNYIFTAFVHTRYIVQISLLVFGGVFVSAIVDILKATKNIFHLRFS